MPAAVYEEAVVKGKRELYEDAFALEKTLEDGDAAVIRREGEEQTAADMARASLGPGERDAFALYKRERVDAILSDDRVFLGFLEDNGVPYLTPTATVVGLAASGKVTMAEAVSALEKLKEHVRDSVYEKARQELGEPRGGEEQ